MGTRRASWRPRGIRASGGWSALCGCRAYVAGDDPLRCLRMQEGKPFGSWASPVDGAAVARDPGWGYALVTVAGGTVYWLEAGAVEGGREANGAAHAGAPPGSVVARGFLGPPPGHRDGAA